MWVLFSPRLLWRCSDSIYGGQWYVERGIPRTVWTVGSVPAARTRRRFWSGVLPPAAACTLLYFSASACSVSAITSVQPVHAIPVLAMLLILRAMFTPATCALRRLCRETLLWRQMPAFSRGSLSVELHCGAT